MNIRRSWHIAALLVSFVMVIAFAMPTSMAYLIAESNVVHNSFTPISIPPQETEVEICVRKTVRSLGEKSILPEGFRFKLENSENDDFFILTTGKDGTASIALPFTEADLGREHVFTLSEIDDGRENVIYSDAAYTIRITLSVDDENRMIAAASMNGEPVQQIIAEFENIYSAGITIPATGDASNIPFYAALMLISVAGMVILLTARGRRMAK